MGCDWYDFTAFYSTGHAVMVLNKDIKEVRTNSTGSSNIDNNRFKDPLDDDEINWLLDQAEGFKIYELEESFCLFMKEGHRGLLWCPSLDVPGPYTIDEQHVEMKIEKASEGEEFDVLFELARKLTPHDRKLSFAPGYYSFSLTRSLMAVEKLERAMGPRSKLQKDESVATECDTTVPLDFEIVVVSGQGETKNTKTIQTNKAILACFLPKFESLLEDVDVTMAQKLELHDLDHTAVKTVLDAFTTRKKVDMPSRWDKCQYNHVQKVLERFGLIETKEKKAKTTSGGGGGGGGGDGSLFLDEHPALSDPRWLDVTFLVGPNKEEIKANRALLASLNPVLCRILYGTGVITTDPSKPIEWPEFDADAVRKVLFALVRTPRGTKNWVEEVVVPIECVESAKALVSYLIESPRKEDLHLYYETPFVRKFEGGTTFEYYCDEDDGYKEGFKLPD